MFSTFRLQRNKLYWKIKHYLNNMLFHISNTKYKLKEKRVLTSENISISRQIIRTVNTSFLFAVFIVSALEGLEIVLFFILNNSNIEVLEIIGTSLVGIKNNFASVPGTINQLLVVIATVVGIFIGLYFTAISVVAGSIFERVPSDLRELFLKERVGNVYVKNLATLTAIAIILLGYKVFGGTPGMLNSLMIIILGCFGVLSFTTLGFRAFLFFDPTKLNHSIFYDLKKSIRLSTIKGFRWFDPNFQAAYQKRASSDILTLDTLVKTCVEEPQLQRQSLSTILQETIFFLIQYQVQRSYIPSDSRWYRRTPKYKNWFLHDTSVLSIALQTQTSIQPEMIPNAYWIEDEIIDTLASTVNSTLEQSNIEVSYKVLNSLGSYLERLGYDLEAKKALQIIDIFEKHIDTYFTSKPLININDVNKDISLALYDAYGLCVMSTAMGFFMRVREFNETSIDRIIKRINWKRVKSMYKEAFPPMILQRLEFLQKRLEFERLVEGKALSPNWYVRQLIIIRYAELIKESLDVIVKTLDNVFIKKSDMLISAGSFILAAGHIQRGLEMCNKIAAHMPQVNKLLDKYEQWVVEKELPWPKINSNSIDNKLEKSYDKLVELLAKCIPSLSTVEQIEDFPDLFGQAYTVACQECYSALMRKKPETFKALFPAIFFGALSAHDKLKKTLAEWNPETAIPITIEPIVDILELSGYAKLYAELFDVPSLWAICEELWNKLFDSIEKPEEIAKLLVSTYEYKKRLFQISPRDILRKNWQRSFHRELRGMNLINNFVPAAPRMKPKELHKSPLIRALVRRRYGPHISAAETFLIIYLLKRPGMESTKFNDRWGLTENLNKELKTNNEDNDA